MTELNQAQEIRARALHTVSINSAALGIKTQREFWLSVQTAADYIRTGSHPAETQSQKRARERQANRGDQ